jgi:site-specific DNA recombinase
MNIPECIPVAIYTRKSTDAKVEQEVHSLSVQRASAESFIASQQHRGWVCLPEKYDDNNISGATLERPALQRLKQHICEGRVKAVVINRLDRISRSLSQFLELMEFFEKHGVALVSVTQNFNTGDSMGRLMVQIIMSFAEFERSLIRDRVTERLHAARRKGRFIGGPPVLGYNIKPKGGELEIDELEAIRVREIFELYLQVRSVKAAVHELHRRDWRNKKWITRQGKVSGGSAFSTSSLYSLLTNPVYIGKVTLKGELFDGQHEGIIDPKLFEKVQTMLAGNSVQDGNRRRNKHSALLKGLLVCNACSTPFVHTYTLKKNRMYRYYTCGHKRDHGADTCPSPSIPAGEIESLGSNSCFPSARTPDFRRRSAVSSAGRLIRSGRILSSGAKPRGSNWIVFTGNLLLHGNSMLRRP